MQAKNRLRFGRIFRKLLDRFGSISKSSKNLINRLDGSRTAQVLNSANEIQQGGALQHCQIPFHFPRRHLPVIFIPFHAFELEELRINEA